MFLGRCWSLAESTAHKSPVSPEKHNFKAGRTLGLQLPPGQGFPWVYPCKDHWYQPGCLQGALLPQHHTYHPKPIILRLLDRITGESPDLDYLYLRKVLAGSLMKFLETREKAEQIPSQQANSVDEQINVNFLTCQRAMSSALACSTYLSVTQVTTQKGGLPSTPSNNNNNKKHKEKLRC